MHNTRFQLLFGDELLIKNESAGDDDLKQLPFELIKLDSLTLVNVVLLYRELFIYFFMRFKINLFFRFEIKSRV